MRKYQPIWETLKKTLEEKGIGVCSIAAHKALHPRIIKAVSREKNIDIGYKLLSTEKREKTIVYSRVQGSKITFYLRVFHIDKNDIRIEDL